MCVHLLLTRQGISIPTMGRTGEDKALSEIVSELSALTKRVESAFPQLGPAAENAATDLFPKALPQALLESIYEARTLRNALFGEDTDLFGEAAWDILLDIAITEDRGKRVAVSDACAASRVPPTTALRYITELEGRGLLERQQDPGDFRRRYLKLTPKARGLLNRFARAFVERSATKGR